jgi:hypothetical protein
MLKKATHIVTLLLWIQYGYSQVPKYSNEFLNIGVGARSLAMANASIAGTNDVTSGYWNPAGLTLMDGKMDLGLMHAEFFAGIAKFDYAGWAYRLDDVSVMGVSVLRFGVDDIPNTLELVDPDGNIQYERIKTFSAADYAFLFSYARKMPLPGLNLGGNAKIIYRKTGEFASAWGFGLDVGLHYKREKWVFGAVGRDITSTFNVWKFNESLLAETFLATGNDLPENALELTLPRLILGAGREFTISTSFAIYGELDIDLTFDGKRNTLVRSNWVSLDPHLGLELKYQDLLFVRLGGGNYQRIPGFNGEVDHSIQPNLGLGISFRNFSIDYALTDIGDQTVALYSNIFTIRYSFE